MVNFNTAFNTNRANLALSPQRPPARSGSLAASAEARTNVFATAGLGSMLTSRVANATAGFINHSMQNFMAQGGRQTVAMALATTTAESDRLFEQAGNYSSRAQTEINRGNKNKAKANIEHARSCMDDVDENLLSPHCRRYLDRIKESITSVENQLG